ncbi:hypothetical protein LTR08_004861 [Meristemomyces frigidus]|nr:hypothetical protein LTR08_004861 [Meristemomyces frigidus]
MATKVPAKSILKEQSTQPQTSDEQKAKADKDRYNLNLALQHAYLIQHHKDVDAQILTSIEALLEIPASATFTPQEARTFTTFVQLYQPSDLDALVEERRIDGHCGYALCRNAPRSATLGEGASWKVGKGAASFCSAKCTRKLLYVKTQLSEVPAWERDPTVPINVRLHEDDRPAGERALPTMRPYKVAKQNDGANDLALERGEKAASLRPRQVMTDKIVEKRNVVHKPMSSLSTAAISSTAIEGYEPKRSALSRNGDDSSDDSDDDDDDGADVTESVQFGRSEGAVTQMWVGSKEQEDD